MKYKALSLISVARINLKYLLKYLSARVRNNDSRILHVFETLRMYQMKKLTKILIPASFRTLNRNFQENKNSDLYNYFMANGWIKKQTLLPDKFTAENLSAISKYWEEPNINNVVLNNQLNLLIKNGQLTVKDVLNYPANKIKTKEWTVTPPEIIYSDRQRNVFDRKSYKLKSHDSGIVNLKHVYATVGSNSFIHENGIYVDEFREIFPPECDPRNEPVVRGVKKKELIVNLTSTEELPLRIVPKAFWLAGPFVGEWGHFINTYLIKFIQYRKIDESNLIPILIPTSTPNNVRSILRKLDPSGSLLEISNEEKIFIEDCFYFPSTVYSPTNGRGFSQRIQSNIFVDPEKFVEMFAYIRKELNLETNSNSPKRILWARENYSRRKLGNQFEFNQIVSNLGFSIFDPNIGDTLEQFNVLYNADFICGEIGSWIYLAGLNPKTKIIVVMSDWDQHWWNEIGSLNKNLESPIRVLLGSRNSFDDYRSENGPHADYHLSLKALKRVSLILENQL